MTECADGESDVSFEFEEDGFDSDEFGDYSETAATSEFSVENSLKDFSKFAYQSYSVQSFIADKVVIKAEELHSQFLPQFLVDELLIMLEYKNWLKLEVLSDYYDDWPKLREACGLPEKRGVKHQFHKRRKFTCNVCFDTGTLTVFSLLCGHEFCSPCYQTYVEKATYQDGMLTCIDPLCNMTMLHIDIVNLINALAAQTKLGAQILELSLEAGSTGCSDLGEDADSDTTVSPGIEIPDTSFQVSAELFFDTVNFSGQGTMYNEANESITQEYPLINSPALIQAVRQSINSNFKAFKWCPANDCTEVVRLEDPVLFAETDLSATCKLSDIPIVLCHNSHEFCFNCQFENHLPLPCPLAKKWIQKCSDDSETLNWLKVNTQACPKCETFIEKNGGCNHVRCTKCNYQFCWICLGDWVRYHSQHWHCNQYSNEAIKSKQEGKERHKKWLSRYLHHYKRFAAHQHSMTGDYKTLDNIHKRVKQVMQMRKYETKEDITWNDVQFFTDTFKSLCAARKTLMWSYAFAFFLSQNNFCEIFQSMQNYLSDSVERLSQQFSDFLKNSPNLKVTRAFLDEKRNSFTSLGALATQRRMLLVKHADLSIEKGQMVFLPELYTE